MRTKAAKALKLVPGAKVLDVATGTGSLAIALAKEGYQVTGVDLSLDMLGQAKKKIRPNLNVRFLNLDATKLPFSTHSFDAATISFGLHDMPPEIGQKVLKEMKRVTKKASPILVADYLEPSSHWIARLVHPLIRRYETPNFRPFTSVGLTDVLKKVGLQVSKRFYWLGLFQYTIVVNR